MNAKQELADAKQELAVAKQDLAVAKKELADANREGKDFLIDVAKQGVSSAQSLVAVLTTQLVRLIEATNVPMSPHTGSCSFSRFSPSCCHNYST